MRCPKFNTTLRVEACISRQGMARKPNNSVSEFSFPYAICLDCETGKMARKGKLNDLDIDRLKADRIDGGVGMENKLRCSNCGEFKDPEEFSPDLKAKKHGGRKYWCRKCDTKKAMEGRKKRLEGLADTPAPVPILSPPEKKVRSSESVERKIETSKPKLDLTPPTLILNFSDCRVVLEKIEDYAIQELRTPANQALWMLREVVNKMTGVGRSATPTGERSLFAPGRSES